MQNALANIHPIAAQHSASNSDLLDAPYLHAIAALADRRGAVRLSSGGGVQFAQPLGREDRAALPVPRDVAPRFLNLPKDRFRAEYDRFGIFHDQVDRFTIAHIQPGYRHVVIPLVGRLDSAQLRAIAKAAETFGHGTIRLTLDAAIHLPNVPEALLRPLFTTLNQVGLLAGDPVAQAA